MIGNPGPSQRIYLIRHGETAWSLDGQHTSRTELALTDQGEADARELGDRLQIGEIGHAFTSPRQRAQRTCELVGLARPPEVESDLAEWDYGDYEGRRSSDICEERPGWNIFRDGCPHGELPDDISRRADRLIMRLVGLPGNIALFSHGQFGCVLAARWIGLPVLDAQHFVLGPTSFSILGYESNHLEMRAILLWNAGLYDFSPSMSVRSQPLHDHASDHPKRRVETFMGYTPHTNNPLGDYH